MPIGIEEKRVRHCNFAAVVGQIVGDPVEAKTTLLPDWDLAEKVAINCSRQTSGWKEREKVRADELEATHKTIKLLSDDDGLELLKETPASPSRIHARGKSVDFTKV